MAPIMTACAGDAGALFDFRARVQHDRPGHEERVDADDHHFAFAVVEHRDAHFARIVEAAVKRLPVSARLFHADARRDVALGKPRFDAGHRLRAKPSGYGAEAEQQGQQAAFHDHELNDERAGPQASFTGLAIAGGSSFGCTSAGDTYPGKVLLASADSRPVLGYLHSPTVPSSPELTYSVEGMAVSRHLSSRGEHVAIVDDEDDMTSVTSALLESLGYTTTCYTSAAQFKKVFEAARRAV